MTTAIAFLALNAAYLALGCGVLQLLGGRLRTPDFVLLGYPAGVATAGIAVALLALVDAVPGLVPTCVLGIVVLAAGFARRRRAGPSAGAESAPRWTAGDAGTVIAVGLCVAVMIARLREWPLEAWDGWAVWSVKAHALYAWGGVSSPVLHSAAYARTHLDYPLLMPGLEAVWLKSVGHFSSETLHLQLVTFAASFACGLFALLRPLIGSALRAPLVLAAAASPPIFDQLAKNYADIPLAFFVALGVLCLCRWLMSSEPYLLRLACLFLAAATLTKNEGTLFALAAFGAALGTSGARGRHRQLCVAAVMTVAPLIPWRLYTATHHLTDNDYDVSLLRHPAALLARADRIPPALHGLAAATVHWSLLLTIPLLGAALGVARRRHIPLGFAGGWVFLSVTALTLIYWLGVIPIHEHVRTSADRVVASLVVGVLALTGPIVGEPSREG